MNVSQSDLDLLADRAQRAGHDSIVEYAIAMRAALVRIADANSGPWGRIAHEALTGRRPGPGWALRAVAQRGHDQLDTQLDDSLGGDAA
jgi:hypothetical protein